MPTSVLFDSVARLPAAGDNAAMALRTLEAGTRIAQAAGEIVLERTVLLGHRFAVRSLDAGDQLLSWSLPFGIAIRPIPAGAYLCNAAMLDALSTRPLPFQLPAEPNFRDLDGPYLLDEANFRPGRQVPRVAEPPTFDG